MRDIDLLQDAVASVRAVSARLGLFLPVALLTNPANPSPLTSLVLGAEAVSRNMSYHYSTPRPDMIGPRSQGKIDAESRCRML